MACATAQGDGSLVGLTMPDAASTAHSTNTVATDAIPNWRRKPGDMAA